jgi:translation initiation factor IF-2
MTGQELRHELTQVNFGVKPTDREIPDTLARGILRVLALKHNRQVDLTSLGLELEEEGVEEREVAASEPQAAAPTAAAVEEAPSVSAPQQPSADRVPTEHPPMKGESLHVLRKLSLEDVSKEAIAKQQEELKSRATPERKAGSRRGDHAAAVKRREGHERQEQIKKKVGTVTLPDSISVKELAEKTGVQVPLIIQTLMKNGVMATITQSIDYDTAAIVATELGIGVQREQREAKVEDLVSRNLEELLKDEPENLVPRPPIVVVMGHVDHGKTAILDAIRETNVVASEAGGITQHIGAYQVEHSLSTGEKRAITFLDTPGHEAFTAMRARGAQITDIAIIVVSAEEGVKPTTIEAIDHAKEAEVPIIVAINKIDKERADPDRVKGELAAQGLQPEEWGGTVPMIHTSAVTKQGIPDLLDHILIIAELKDFRANPNRTAVATVIESHLDTSLGPLATVIVNSGTLRVGDLFICGEALGKVRALVDAKGERLGEVLPSGAARVSGLQNVPTVGDILQVVSSEKDARSLLDQVQRRAGLERHRSFADLVTRLSEGKLLQLKVVLKTDAQGSLEAIQNALAKQSEGSEATVKVIHGAVGPVTESDVMMAAASDGIVLSFNAPISADVERTAEREGVKVREYAILYELLDEVDKLRKGLVEPVEEEHILGHLDVRGIFLSKKSEQIVGGRVTDGIIKRVPFRVQREGKVIGTGRITSLKHVDKDIKEAKEGTECGMRVESTVAILEGDILEAYVRELKKKEE